MSRYQYREIGEGEGWRDCSKDAYDAYGRDPHIDTRIKPMAEGCRSAISPCPHQCRDPYTLCAHCDDRRDPGTIDYMRRCDLARMIETERLITDAMAAVEKMPGDVRLTDAVSLLFAARTRLADYVDGIPGIVTHPIQTLAADAEQ